MVDLRIQLGRVASGGWVDVLIMPDRLLEEK